MNEQRAPTVVCDDRVPRGGVRARTVVRLCAIGASWLLLGACGGNGGEGSARDDAGIESAGAESTGPGSGSDDGPNGGGGGDQPEPSCDDEGERITSVPLRRLSHVEYERTVQDLLGGVQLPEHELPTDLAPHGFENDAESLHPSSLLVERYSDYAAAAAEQAVAQGVEHLTGCDGAGDLEGCAETFVTEFGLRAFRRPLSRNEIDRFTDFLLDEASAVSFEGAVQLTIEAFLQAPSFVYRIELDPGDVQPGDVVAATDYEVASRLSYFLWQSMPDDELFDAAAAGELRTEAQIEAQARRMLEEHRATDALVDFHRQWLDFDAVLGHSKDPDLYPAWTTSLRDAMFEEAQRFVALVFEEGHGTLGELLTSRQTEVNTELAALYDVAAPDSSWSSVELDPEKRAGVLTLPAVLASQARPTNGSPPLRGVFVLERLLCQRPPSPPNSADTSVPEPPDDGVYTNRELFEGRTSQPECQGCHGHIDGVGFTFEHYDGIGRWRNEDNGLPVDASGRLLGTGDQDGEVGNAIELTETLADADTTRACVATNWFRYARGREPAEEDGCTVERLQHTLAETEGDIRELMVAMTTSPAFRHRIVQHKG